MAACRFYNIFILVLTRATIPLVFLTLTTTTTTTTEALVVCCVINNHKYFPRRSESQRWSLSSRIQHHHDDDCDRYTNPIQNHSPLRITKSSSMKYTNGLSMPIRRKVPMSMFNSHTNQDDDDDNDDKFYFEKDEYVDATISSNVKIVSSTTPLQRNTSKYNQLISTTITSNPTRSLFFSLCMTLSGAILGPFLDSYHSLYNVLQYNQPLTFSFFFPTDLILLLVTTYWVPPLFGIAGFLIGWMYILLDVYYHKEVHTTTDTITYTSPNNNNNNNVYLNPSPPKILYGIAYFTFQYWLSGYLYHSGVISRDIIFDIMSISALIGFVVLDRTRSGFITSMATALGGPLIEVGLITLSRHDALFHGMGYHYTDLGETGYFPLWIVPIYFLGGPANGNLARGYWALFSSSSSVDSKTITTTQNESPCSNCNDTRCSPCPNW